jgi:hypothetical protein
MLLLHDDHEDIDSSQENLPNLRPFPAGLRNALQDKYGIGRAAIFAV